MVRRLLVVILSVLVVTPAVANEYYVAQKAVKKCKVVDEKPDGTTWVMVGTSSYPTLDAARAAKKAAPECQQGETK
jgi:hypothetical protein